MAKDSENVFKAALQLPVNIRAELAATLIDSLDGSPDADIESAWREETLTRLHALDEKSISTIPWQEVRRKILGNVG